MKKVTLAIIACLPATVLATDKTDINKIKNPIMKQAALSSGSAVKTNNIKTLQTAPISQPVKIEKPKFSRIMTVNYDPNGVVNVVANPFVTTTIEFSPNETVNGKDITNGDSQSWMAQTYTSKPNYLGLKPVRLGSDTNMTVVTNEHTYYFHLISTDKKPAQYAIRFQYPQQELASINKNKQYFEDQKKANLSGFVDPSKYNMNYTFSGDTNLMPVQIWDNGKVTYMQFSPNQPQPSIFAVEGKKGKEAVVNYRRLKNDLVLVERVAPQFTLRLGPDHTASIFNQTYIKQIKKHESMYHNKNFFESTIDYINPFSSSK